MLLALEIVEIEINQRIGWRKGSSIFEQEEVCFYYLTVVAPPITKTTYF